MEKFDANDEVLKVERNGMAFDVRYPGSEEIAQYTEKVRAAEPEAVLGVLLEFLDSLGFPKAEGAKVPLGKLRRLAQILCDIEKKS